jgi:MFS family permease
VTSGPPSNRSSGPAPDSAASPREPLRQPWWIPPILGRLPADLEPHHIRLIGLVALTLLFESYDIATLSAAIKHIREDFGFDQSQMPQVISYVRLGAVPGLIFILPFADRIGRRQLFLASVLGMGVTTFLTAFSQNVNQFIALQMISRTFYVTGAAATYVIVSEELPPSARGWGIGVLGALAAVGFGLSAALFSAVDILPHGWRALYLVGVVPMFLVPLLRREIRETGRFTKLQAEGAAGVGILAGLLGWWRPYLTLVREWPLRSAGVMSIALLSSAGNTPGIALLADYVQTDRGWTPGQYGAMVVIGGAFGIVGNTFAGRMADRFGRRVVGAILLIVFPLIGFVLYRSSGWLIVVIWVPFVFSLTGGETIMRAVTTELFPTSSRATATGLLMLFQSIGAAIGLTLVTLLTPAGESTAVAISLIVFLSALAGMLMLLFPETAGRELEAISESS